MGEATYLAKEPIVKSSSFMAALEALAAGPGATHG